MSDFISVPSFPPYQPIKPKRPRAKAKLYRSISRTTIQTFRPDTLKHAPVILWLWFVGIHAAFGCFARLPASPPPPTRLVPINSELHWRLAGASSGFAKWRGCMVHVSGAPSDGPDVFPRRAWIHGACKSNDFYPPFICHVQTERSTGLITRFPVPTNQEKVFGRVYLKWLCVFVLLLMRLLNKSFYWF